MKEIEKHVQSKLDDIIDAAKSDKVALPENCVFKLRVQDGRFVAVEESANWGVVVFTPPE